MCSRYELKSPREEIAARFDLEMLADYEPIPELRPTNFAPILTGGGLIEVAAWGIPAPWDGKPLINARGETLREKATFRPLLEKRCLVPASAYFEWRNDGKRKRKNRISAQEDLFAFAGLTDGKHFTIVTCTPAAQIAYIHGRMPVILDRQMERQWIDPTLPFDTVSPLLEPYKAPLEAEEEEFIERQPDLFG
jgi:putative SOS response-associated peptidase YedK